MTKTTIQGVPPKYDAATLQAKQDQAVAAFLSSIKSKHYLRADLPSLFFSELENLIKQGYTVILDYPYSFQPLSYAIHLTKPDSLLVDEIEQVKAKAREEYIAYLQSEHERYQALLVQQMIEKAEREEEEKQAKLKEKQLETFKEKAKQVYTPLEIPSEY